MGAAATEVHRALGTLLDGGVWRGCDPLLERPEMWQDGGPGSVRRLPSPCERHPVSRDPVSTER